MYIEAADKNYPRLHIPRILCGVICASIASHPNIPDYDYCDTLMVGLGFHYWIPAFFFINDRYLPQLMVLNTFYIICLVFYIIGFILKSWVVSTIMVDLSFQYGFFPHYRTVFFYIIENYFLCYWIFPLDFRSNLHYWFYPHY